MIKLKQLLTEKTVRLSTMKDANFEPGQFVQLMGKKGMVKLDKKSVHSLAKIIRQLSGKKGMGWSFTMGEGKLKEGNPYGLTYKKGKTVTVTHKTSGKELVIIDKPNVRKEYEKIGYVAEGNITEKKETGIDVARRIVKNKQHEKGVDVQTANLILKIHQAYSKNPSLQKKFAKLPLKKLAQGVWRFVK